MRTDKDDHEKNKCNNDTCKTGTDDTDSKLHETKTTDWSKCIICIKIFKSKATSTNHDKKFHMNKEIIPQYKCDHCNAVFEIKFHLCDHLEQKHIKCTSCSKIFSSKPSLETHMKIFHKQVSLVVSSKHTLERDPSLKNHKNKKVNT